MDTSASQPDLSSLLDHSEWLHALARRLVRDPGAADDLVQETWIAALRHPPDAARPARPWLAGVLRNLVLLRRRTEGRRERRQRAAARPDRLPSAAEIAESVDAGRKLAGAVLELAEPYRTTVLLRYWHDLSSAEIARRQGVPEGTVRWRLKRGMDELRGRLDERYGERRSWEAAFVAMLDARALSREGVLTSSSVAVAGILGSIFVGLLVVGWTLLAVTSDEKEPGFAQLAAGPLLDESGEVVVTVADAPGMERESLARERAVRVLDALGRPLAGATVVLDEGSREGHDAITDAGGIAGFTGVQGAARVYVRAEGTYLVTGELAAEERETIVQMPGGGELSGRLAVAGAPPRESVRVALALDHPLFEGPIPDAVESHFGTARRAIVHTGPEGAFRFTGLPADWSGTLELPRTYRLAGKTTVVDFRGAPLPPSNTTGPRLRFDRPQAGIVIELERRLYLVGRVLERTREPAREAEVELELRWPDGTSTLLCERSGDEGRFVFRVDDERFTRLELDGARLRAIAGDGLAMAERELAPEQALGTAELEALVLQGDPRAETGSAARPFHVLVRGSDAREFAGSRVESLCGDRTLDTARFVLEGDCARARFSYTGSAEITSLRLADALDRTVLQRALAPTELAAGELELAGLPELSAIELSIRDAGGRALVGATVEVAGSESIGARPRSDARGVLALAPLLGGPLDLIVRHAGYATRLARVEVENGGSLQEIVLERGHELVVEVIDSLGRPLADARVEAHGIEPSPRWIATALEPGRYRLSELGAGSLTLEIARGGESDEVLVSPLAGVVRLEFPARASPGDR